MTNLRVAKVQKVADHLQPVDVHGDDDGNPCGGVGSTFGAIVQLGMSCDDRAPSCSCSFKTHQPVSQ